MRTIRTKVYKFIELSETAQAKAIESFYDINVDFDWWDFIYDDFKQLCKTICIEVDLKKTYFNGFYSQGSGSSFTADITNVKECLQAIQAEKWNEHAPNEKLSFYSITKNMLRIASYCWADIETTNREISVRANVGIENCGGGSNVDAAFDELETFFDDVANTLNGWFYSSLEKEYEYLTSEDAIKESIIANGYEFTQDGNRF